jgi:GNAT superfamily N-acetyltransferase
VIPQDRWREPYMDLQQLESEIAAGVVFWGYEADGALIGVMGIQAMEDVDLIRHAYVLPGSQRLGVGGALLSHLRGLTARRVLVGTWAAADWANPLLPAQRLRAGLRGAEERAARDLLGRP